MLFALYTSVSFEPKFYEFLDLLYKNTILNIGFRQFLTKSTSVMCIGMNVGGATHSSHLFQPIEFRMKNLTV